jgi:hypothetical protein
MDGTPDETIDEDDQDWAMNKLQEFVYRKMFHLTKRQMAEEPLEDIVINLKLNHIIELKQKSEMTPPRQSNTS